MPPVPRPTPAPTEGRALRSRLQRPCDACRRHKHLCMIPVLGEPCVSCKTRKKDCTFDMPPTARKRKPRPDQTPGSDSAKNTTSSGVRTGSASSGPTPPSVNVTAAPNGHMPVVITKDGRSIPQPMIHPQWLPPQGGPTSSSPTASRTPTIPSPITPITAMPNAAYHVYGYAPPTDGTNQHVHPTPNPGSVPTMNGGHGAHMRQTDTGRHSSILPDHSRPISLTLPSVQHTDEKLDHQTSLDPRDGEEEESHFVGSGAFFGLTLSDSNESDTGHLPHQHAHLNGHINRSNRQPSANFSRIASLAFRQVSANSRLPAYFIKHPSLLYGRGPSSALNAFETVLGICGSLGDSLMAKALSSFQHITLPALPFCNAKSLEHACMGTDSGRPVPYALLAGIVAHCTPYLPELRVRHKDLWAQGLLALEDEFRQPRLRTIQLALLILSSRPSENVGQSDIGLARAVGAAHLLGLHMDPSNWTLPLWERRLRKRMWWSLLMHDKWRALIYGRPSNVHKNNYNMPLPTIDDADDPESLSPSQRMSFESFIATCKLTMIIDKLVDKFYTVQAITGQTSPVTRLAALEEIRLELDEFDRSLPAPLGGLQWYTGMPGTAMPSGVRSFQLSLFGAQVVTNRLVLENLADIGAPHATVALRNALMCCQRMTDLIVRLTAIEHCDIFWMPYSTHHISNCVSLLLRIAILDRHGDLPPVGGVSVVEAASACTISLVDSLIATYAEWTWDVAESALRRVATLLLFASTELPMMAETYAVVAKALNWSAVTGLDDAPPSADHLLESLGLGAQPDQWLETDLSWLDSGLLYGVVEGMGVNSGATGLSGLTGMTDGLGLPVDVVGGVMAPGMMGGGGGVGSVGSGSGTGSVGEDGM